MNSKEKKEQIFRTKRTVFVLISGKAGVGKTTLGEYLTKKLSSIKGITVLHTAFAYPLKRIATSVFGWDGNKDSKGRRLLQVIGTEAGREYNENIWVKKTLDFALTSSIFPPNFVIIDDWRYPNECTYIEDQKVHDVITIRVEAPNREILKGTPEYNHISETSLPDGYNDLGSWNDLYGFVVNNKKDLGVLYLQGSKIIKYLEESFILE